MEDDNDRFSQARTEDDRFSQARTEDDRDPDDVEGEDETVNDEYDDSGSELERSPSPPPPQSSARRSSRMHPQPEYEYIPSSRVSSRSRAQSNPSIDTERRYQPRRRSHAEAKPTEEDDGENPEQQEAEEEAAEEESPPRRPGARLGRIVEQAVSVLSVDYRGTLAPNDLYKVLLGHTGNAALETEKLQREARKNGEIWEEDMVSRVFCERLINVGRQLITGKHGDLGERLLKTTGGSTGYGPSEDLNDLPESSGTSSGNSGNVGDPSNTSIQSLGPKCGTSVFCLSSVDRDSWLNLPVGVYRYSLTSTTGVDYHLSISKIRRIVLRGVNVNSAALLTGSNYGSTFYVGIDEITNEYNRESSMNEVKGHFECFAKPNLGHTDTIVQIVSGTIDLPATSINISTLTFRFLDDRKRVLTLEQDHYAITAYAWDDVNQRLKLTIGAHTIATGDRIILRGMVFPTDINLLDDSNDYRAIVISPTQITILAYLSVAVPRIPTYSNAYLVDLEKAVKLTVAFDYKLE
jgi:hypothetical protein